MDYYHLQVMKDWLKNRLHVELAEKAGLKSPNTIGMYLRKKRFPSDEVALKIAKAIGADPQKFVLSVHEAKTLPEAKDFFKPNSVPTKTNIFTIVTEPEDEQIAFKGKPRKIDLSELEFMLGLGHGNNYTIIRAYFKLTPLEPNDCVIIDTNPIQPEKTQIGNFYLLFNQEKKVGKIVKLICFKNKAGIYSFGLKNDDFGYKEEIFTKEELANYQIFPIVSYLHKAYFS